MRKGPRLVWKLSAVVVAIMTAAIAVSGYVNNLIAAYYSQESARAFLRFNSESIVDGIGELMMSRNNQGIEELITAMSQDSEVYGSFQLVSHHSGQVVACRFDQAETRFPLEDWHCAVCHDREDLGGGDVKPVDTITTLPEGGRILSVMAPVVNEPRCRSAACHAHTNSPPILGFLHTDYSLQRMDAMVVNRRILVSATVVTSLVLAVVVLWFMFTRLLERPIHGLIEGTKRIAAHELDFRFAQTRRDEIGILEESFNTMTDTIQAHQLELLGAKERLESVIESSADIIITVNLDGLVETFNRGAEQSLGYRPDEVIGKPVETLYAESRERDNAIAQLADADHVRNYETRFLTKDGKIRNVLLTLSVLRDAEGTPIGTFGIGKDVTLEKKLQRELVQSQKFAAIGQAVTAIQHAVKNMLNSLKGGVYLARDGMDKEDKQQAEEGWAMVEGGIERISSLSQHMLNYAKEWKRDLRRVDVNGLIVKIGEEHRQIATEQRVALRCEVAEGLPVVLCDSRLIHMAVTDLVVNALDACVAKVPSADARSEVVLKTSLNEDGNSIVIEVRDNGCGMNEETKRRIFVPFFTTKMARGTGLGLALTARVINVHEGEISVESEPGRGTTFRVHLPIDGPRDGKEAIDDQESTAD